MDPRRTSHKQRTAPLSPLMAAKAKAAKTGGVVNACPWGCADANLDQNGYCYHIVGFVREEDVRKGGPVMEPMTLRGGHRTTLGGKFRQPLKKGDRLVKTTTCYRVYRDVEPSEEELKYIEEVCGEKIEDGPLPDEFTVGRLPEDGGEAGDEDDEEYTDSELEEQTAPAKR